jgi:hypothetical protein
MEKRNLPEPFAADGKMIIEIKLWSNKLIQIKNFYKVTLLLKMYNFYRVISSFDTVVIILFTKPYISYIVSSKYMKEI